MKNQFKNIIFVRWGNLNPTKHKEGRLPSESPERTFHTAPVVKGIYAFPKGLIEPFLLGISEPTSYGVYNVRVKPLKTENGNLINVDDFYQKTEDGKFTDNPKPEYLRLMKKLGLRTKDMISLRKEYPEELDEDGDPVVRWFMYYYTGKHEFTFRGNLWHHFKEEVSKEDIISEKGDWVKTSYKVYEKALHRTFIKERFNTFLSIKLSGKKVSGNPHSMFRSMYDMDRYEVFIDSKIK